MDSGSHARAIADRCIVAFVNLPYPLVGSSGSHVGGVYGLRATTNR